MHLSLIEALIASRSFSEAGLEADSFLRRWPDSERRDEVRLLRANVHREWGDCSGALADYEALAQGGPFADDALWFAAICDKRDGEARWRDRLRQYQQRFPDGRHKQDADRAAKEDVP